jgi:hypothetical protein
VTPAEGVRGRRAAEPEGRLAGLASAAGRAVDGILDLAVAGLGLWTVLYGLMLAGLPLGVGTLVWVLLLAGAVVLRVRRTWWPAGAPVTGGQTAGALVVALVLAALSSVVSRPEWDDASFVVRSTWVAEHGRLARGDMIFSADGAWPATFGQVPNISSIETLLGAVARWTGLPAGDVVYRYLVPLATFAAVWAVWRLLRAWGARRPLASLVLAMVVVVMGGYSSATFGSFHLARIWQGKSILVAVLVPYLYAVLCAGVAGWRRREGAHRAALPLVLAGAAAAAVGASSTAVFLVPLVVAVGVLPLLLRRRPLDALVLVAAGWAAPLVAGVVTVLSPSGSGNEGGRAAQWLWARVVDDPWVGVVLVVAAVAVLLGAIWPRWAGSVDAEAQRGVVLVVVAGLLCSIPPVYPVLTTLMGGDAIAYRLAWLVPVPAVVGLLASLPARRALLPVAPVAAGALAVLLVAGQPLWSTADSVQIGRPGTWKVRDQADLAAARWIVEQQPEGRYLAPNWVAMMTGVLTSQIQPVGTRMDYVRSLDEIPEARTEQRVLLQEIADGSGPQRDPARLGDALEALDDLDVDVACVAWSDEFTAELFAGFEPGLAVGPWTCWSR